LLSSDALTPCARADTNWTGATNSDWFDSGNWSSGVPSFGDDAFINNGTPNPSPTISAADAATNTTSIGSSSGLSGSIAVQGANATWNGVELIVGDVGTGNLTISDGAEVTMNWSTTFGQSEGSIGRGTVQDAVLSAVQGLTVGEAGTGYLTISQGGYVSSIVGTIGGSLGGVGSVLVTGSNSTWVVATQLDVGTAGTGTLIVEDGGYVGASSVIFGLTGGSKGDATISGAGTLFEPVLTLEVGALGEGTLTIQSGATVNAGETYIGKGEGSTGTVRVTGASLTYAIDPDFSTLYVGDEGNGTLAITNGGQVSLGSESYVGYAAGSQGLVVVSGKDANANVSSWTANALTIGQEGRGTVTVSDGGLVIADEIRIAASVGSNGALNIGSAPADAAQAPGTVDTQKVAFGAGNGAINFNHTNRNYVFAPEIGSESAGAGAVNAYAGNTVLATDSPDFSGATTVYGGSLVVNAFFGNSPFSVNGGTLGGTGTVGTTVVDAGGTVAPGYNGIGTLSVNGDFTQRAGSVYAVQIAPGNLSDLISTSGHADIEGATLSVQQVSGSPYLTGHWHVLGAAGGVYGSYNLLETPYAFYSLSLTYDPHNVWLNAAVLPFATAAETRNQFATANGLQSLPAGNPLWEAIMALPTFAEARVAFNQLSGEAHASIKAVLVDDSRFVRSAALDRLRDDDQCSTEWLPVSAKDVPVVVPCSNGLAAWGRGFGSWGTLDGNGNAHALDHNTGGFFAGFDGIVGSGIRAGFLSGASHSTYKASAVASNGSSDNYHFGLYGGGTWGPFALRVGGAYTILDISLSRSVAFTGYSDRLKSDYQAGTGQAFGEAGYRLGAVATPVGAVVVEPFAGLAFVNVHSDALAESGGAAALAARSRDTGVGYSTLGVHLSGDIPLGGIGLTAKGSFGWRHAFGDVTPSSTFAFSGGDAFTVAGTPISKDLALVEAGLGSAITSDVTVGVCYVGQFGSRSDDNGVRGSVVWKF